MDYCHVLPSVAATAAAAPEARPGYKSTKSEWRQPLELICANPVSSLVRAQIQTKPATPDELSSGKQKYP